MFYFHGHNFTTTASVEGQLPVAEVLVKSGANLTMRDR